MKNIVTICLAVFTFIVAQDTTASVSQEPQLPGWGIYVGGAFGSATSVDDLPDGHSIESRLIAPNIGVSKGMFLGGVPLIVGAGYHPRGYTYELDNPFTGSKTEVETQVNMLDVWASVPYPIGDRAILQAGFLLGTCLGGTQKTDDEEEDIDDIEGELDYGIMLGGGFAITQQIGVNVGYYFGLAEFDEMMKFNGLIFNLGYNF
tara:strand:- start:13 stop:624 length:612 start_codon:yes stop_codon:yes gene_type:complete